MVGKLSKKGIADRQAILESLKFAELPPGVKAIPLTRGQHTLVDEDDYALLMQWNWYACKRHGGVYYATRAVHVKVPEGGRKQIAIMMHNVIMNPPPGFEVDHINNDPLDNRRCNLRVGTHRENMYNLRKQSKGSSQFKGVYWHIRPQCWASIIKIDGKAKHLGLFESEEEAAIAYNAAARIHHGEFAKLNPVEDRKCLTKRPPRWKSRDDK